MKRSCFTQRFTIGRRVAFAHPADGNGTSTRRPSPRVTEYPLAVRVVHDAGAGAASVCTLESFAAIAAFARSPVRWRSTGQPAKGYG